MTLQLIFLDRFEPFFPAFYLIFFHLVHRIIQQGCFMFLFLNRKVIRRVLISVFYHIWVFRVIQIIEIIVKPIFDQFHMDIDFALNQNLFELQHEKLTSTIQIKFVFFNAGIITEFQNDAMMFRFLIENFSQRIFLIYFSKMIHFRFLICVFLILFQLFEMLSN